MFKVNKKDIERNQVGHSVVLIVNFQQISQLVGVLVLLVWDS